MEFLAPIEPTHPVFDFPKGADADAFLAKFGADGWNKMMSMRNERILFEKQDPYNGHVELPVWHLADFITGIIDWEQYSSNRKPDGSPWEIPIPAEWITDEIRDEFKNSPADMLYISGGNRSSKTTYCIDRAFRAIKENPRSRLWMFHTTAAMSKEYHQLPMHDIMPEDDKKTGKTEVGYVSFKDQTAFADGTFRLRNRSACWFHSYQEDLGFAEGGELGAFSRKRSIGAVCDEDCPLHLLEKLKARIATRNAICLNPYTAVEGYTPLVKWYREGAKTVLSATAKFAGKPKTLPIVEVKTVKIENLDPFKIATIFFWSEWNPYANFSQLRRTHSMDIERVKLIKFYGYTESEKNTIFPKLSENIHAFDPQELPSEGTNYHYCDPCGQGRNWFMLWCRVDVNGRIWVYREWPSKFYPIPSVGIPGPWAIQGMDKTHKYGGLIGDGQRGFGFGFLDYKNEIARLEQWNDANSGKPLEEWSEEFGSVENIQNREIDSRFANTPHGTASGRNRTLIDECNDIRLFFKSANGDDIASGISMINSRLAYRELEGGAIEQPPMLLISRQCENLWFALRNWTGLGGSKEATKDPVDVLRYLVKSAPQYIDPNLRCTGPYGGRCKTKKTPDSLSGFFNKQQ